LTRCTDLFNRTRRPGEDDGTFESEAAEVMAPADTTATRVTTGLTDIDHDLQGIRNGEAVIVAARPSIGKTALCTQMAAHLALKLGIKTAYFTLEMNKLSLLERVAAQVAGVDFWNIRQRRMDSRQSADVAAVLKRLQDGWPLKFFKCRRFTADDFEAQARRLVALDGCGMIFVDYVQRMAVAEQYKGNNRRLGVEENSRRIIDVCGELNVPVVLVSQLNRLAEGVEPGLEHLAESGTLEMDADIILLLHRVRTSADALAILAKQRSGRVAKIPLTWNGQCVRFENRSTAAQDAAVSQGLEQMYRRPDDGDEKPF
jgi:replicative DNA helicase